jgi:Asp-tRNA(Asn)/Glu-tRNA(Gln) amidotransferase A subunit family amidase
MTGLTMGQLQGLSVGLSFIGSENKDFELLEMAYCFEQLTPGKLSIYLALIKLRDSGFSQLNS